MYGVSGRSDACSNVEKACGTVITVIVVATAILLALKVAAFITGLICTAATGLFLLGLAAYVIDSCHRSL